MSGKGKSLKFAAKRRSMRRELRSFLDQNTDLKGQRLSPSYVDLYIKKVHFNKTVLKLPLEKAKEWARRTLRIMLENDLLEAT